MAGDWLKMEIATPDKPEVLAMTAAMGWDDPDMTVGKLFRVWRWFDQQTMNGNAAGVTSALLDRICGVTGFAAAMAKVGWLIVTEDGISLPNFDRHNGETAKQRALGAKRVAKHKSNAKDNDKGNAKSNGPSVTNALPREEKRREDIKTSFDAFWAEYPKKQSKGDAEKAWAAIKPEEHLAGQILQAVQRAKTSEQWRKESGQFIPHPATWLRAKGWLDDLSPRLASVGGTVDPRFKGAK